MHSTICSLCWVPMTAFSSLFVWVWTWLVLLRPLRWKWEGVCCSVMMANTSLSQTEWTNTSWCFKHFLLKVLHSFGLSIFIYTLFPVPVSSGVSGPLNFFFPTAAPWNQRPVARGICHMDVTARLSLGISEDTHSPVAGVHWASQLPSQSVDHHTQPGELREPLSRALNMSLLQLITLQLHGLSQPHLSELQWELRCLPHTFVLL